jgi:hypothetical protein
LFSSVFLLSKQRLAQNVEQKEGSKEVKKEVNKDKKNSLRQLGHDISSAHTIVSVFQTPLSDLRHLQVI